MFVTRNAYAKYKEPAGDGKDGGGGQQSEEEIAAGAAAAAQAAADAAALAAGKKAPSDEEARLLKENMKKKGELAKSAEDIGKLQAQLKAFEGIDPEAIRKMLGEQKNAEDKQLEAKGDYERLKQRMAEEHVKEVKTLQDQLLEIQGKLGKATGTINELSIGTQFGQSKFIGEELTLTASKAKVIYAEHFDLEDGKIVGYDKPRGATSRTALVDQYGNSVAFDEAMRKIVDADPEKDYLLRSKAKPGASSDSKKGGTPPAAGPTDSMSKITAGLKSMKIG